MLKGQSDRLGHMVAKNCGFTTPYSNSIPSDDFATGIGSVPGTEKIRKGET